MLNTKYLTPVTGRLCFGKHKLCENKSTMSYLIPKGLKGLKSGKCLMHFLMSESNLYRKNLMNYLYSKKE